MFRRQRGVPIPEESRYDRMSPEDLYSWLESALGSTTHLIDVYRSAGTDRELVLANAQAQLEDALAATKALRRKLL